MIFEYRPAPEFASSVASDCKSAVVGGPQDE